MFLRILKKDLKRKKTMNIILLLFVIMATMFAASSVNNIIAVMSGLDNYFEKANMSDHFIISLSKDPDAIEDMLSQKPNVSDFRTEKQLVFHDNDLTRNGEKFSEFSSIGLALSVDNAQINYFNKDNEIIKSVPRGKAYLTGCILNSTNFESGDEIQLKIGDTELTLEYAGIGKDAFLGSDMMTNPRIIMNNEDYEKLAADEKAQENNSAAVFYINGPDAKALESDLSDIPDTVLNVGISVIRTSYIMNTIVAGLLLIVSVCLILVSFVMLRFTISFTINEEFREIGVMKALGLKNRSVRGLFLVKYLGIAAIGAVIGFFLSIPFGNMLLSSVSSKMYLGSDSSAAVGVLCSLAVVLVILAFCWRCTRKIKKLSPIDAVRSGQTGERFKKKGLLRLGKSKLGATGFLALNDVFSSPKQFGIMTVIFTVCLLLVMCLANTGNTLASRKLLPLMCSTDSDIYITDTDMIMEVMTGETTVTEQCDKIEKKLTDNGLPCSVHAEGLVSPAVEFKGNKLSPTFMYCKDTKASDYSYSEGYAPKYSNEIALTSSVAEKLEAGIGDKVNITIDGKTDEYIVTALFQSMVKLGETGRFHESLEVPDSAVSQVMGFQIDFDDSPDEEEINSRISRVKDIFDTKYVDDTDGFVMSCIGEGVKDTINGVKVFVLLITVIIVIMISVLMERSFISKEKPEIALMKAMGFKSRSVRRQHTLRFLISAAIAAVLAILLSTPVTKLCIDPIFGIMGALDGVEYNIKPVEVFAVYPVIIAAATVLGAYLTAMYMKTIKASDTSDIE